jgi:hypothetical protein
MSMAEGGGVQMRGVNPALPGRPWASAVHRRSVPT